MNNEIEIPKDLKAGDIVQIKDRRIAVIGHGISSSSVVLKEIIRNATESGNSAIIVVQEDMTEVTRARLKEIANQKIKQAEERLYLKNHLSSRNSLDRMYHHKDYDERANQKQRGKWIR